MGAFDRFRKEKNNAQATLAIAEQLERQFLAFQVGFGRSDVIALRKLCAAESINGLFVPFIAREMSKDERRALLDDVEAQLVKIIDGFLNIEEIEKARVVISAYEMEEEFSQKIEKIEEEKLDREREARMKQEEGERRQADEERAAREKEERDQTEKEVMRAFDLSSQSEKYETNTSQRDNYSPPIDWRSALYSAWRILRIAGSVIIFFLIAKFLYDNWRQVILIAIIGFFLYAWYRGYLRRFFR